ncbi:carbamoyltransferase C-terminal domain-containing protein [Desulfocurvus sp. DL9XJH121]
MSKDILILGIHDGHNCGATLTRNGVVLASVSEERLTRRKNEVGFPAKSIVEVLRIAGVGAGDLDEAAYASNFMHSPDHLLELGPWYRVGLEDQRRYQQQPKGYQKVVFDQRRAERIELVCELIKIKKDKVTFVEHHEAHVAAAYYSAPNYRPGKPLLGITCDGSGDGIAATVSVCQGNVLRRIAETPRHASLGKVYSRVTMMMGMKPWEHEYKLMGMAPYSDPDRSRKAAAPLFELLRLRGDGLGFEQAGELSTNFCYEYLREIFERVRFDTICGAVQLFTEEMLTGYVRGAINHTGIRDVCLAGGVFMNVKANMLVAQMPEVDSIYVMPSGADESLSIGACLHRYYALSGDENHAQSVFRDLYFGADYDEANERKAMEELLPGTGVTVSTPEDIDLATADLLAAGDVVARCRGRMEWGARALGNRSILARADDYRVVAKINDMIKMRDFWMPFAPAIKAECKDRYMDDPKDQKPYFMTYAYESRPETYEHLTAGSHPKDRTLRPQVVTREANLGYHSVINRFEELTGMGVIMNTSFNLHGFPICADARDGIDVFLHSGLDHLALNGHLLSKPNRG